MCAICHALDGDDRARPRPPAFDHGLSEAQIAAGRHFLRRHPSVDVHAHPGRFFMQDGAARSAFEARYAPPFAERAIGEMTEGGISAVLFATVADHVLLGMGAGGLGAQREFDAGEAIADHARQIGVLEGLIGHRALTPGREAREIRLAHAERQVACVFSVEGGDFVEDRIERIGEAHARGVRAITIIHYHVNQIGDTQTESPVHGGLTPLGADIVREMDRAGILVDLAHASFAASAAAAEISTRPMMISHSNVAAPGIDHPRLISLDHARLVTRGGGIVGAVPAGFAQARFGDYIDTILRMADQLGVDHVAIGTDMDFTFRPVFTRYGDWPLIPAALLARGMHESEVARIMGGNFMRILP